MKLLFLGPPRTATNSFFQLLRKHPDITPSVNKEPFNTSPYKDIFPRRYFGEFKLINEKVKILMDGTPCAYDYFQDKVIKIPLEKKIIYPIRNPFDRIYSQIKQTIITNNRKDAPVIFPLYIKENLNIDEVELKKYLLRMMDSVHLKHAFDVTNDIMIFRLDRLNLNDIYDFLEVEPINEELQKLNQMRVWYGDGYKRIRQQVDRFWKREFKYITKLILDDLHKIKQFVDVEDWIEEANNILSNV